MALVVKNNGEAVVEEPKTTASANTVQPTAAADAGSAEKVEVSKPSTSTGSGASGTSVPENVTSYYRRIMLNVQLSTSSVAAATASPQGEAKERQRPSLPLEAPQTGHFFGGRSKPEP